MVGGLELDSLLPQLATLLSTSLAMTSLVGNMVTWMLENQILFTTLVALFLLVLYTIRQLLFSLSQLITRFIASQIYSYVKRLIVKMVMTA